MANRMDDDFSLGGLIKNQVGDMVAPSAGE